MAARSAGRPTPGVSTVGLDLRATARVAAAADAAGLDAWTSETYSRSGLVSLAAMAATTERCRLGSSILYGVGRSPLVLATDTLAIDELSGGRLLLGLGNGTRRMLSHWHSVDPAAPAVRMEELVGLLRRLWRLHEGAVRHSGRFYTVDIAPTGPMAPPLRDRLPIFTGGVNPRMIESAGRVADGLVGHPLFSLAYLEEVVGPPRAPRGAPPPPPPPPPPRPPRGGGGAHHAQRSVADVGIAHMVITAVDADEERARRDAAAQIAVYAATKSYAPMLEQPGFATEARAIRAAFEQHDLPGMVDAVSDELVDAMAVAGTPAQVRDGLRRFDGVVDHLIAYVPNVGVEPERIEVGALALVDALATSGAPA